MDKTKVNFIRRMCDFVFDNKIIVCVLTTIFVVVMYGGVALASVGKSSEDPATANIEECRLVPIQQGTTTKVNFLPVYNGDIPPCNFYKKESNGSFTLIADITSMGSLGQKIQDMKPENVYTDGCGQTFYGFYDTVWTNAFEDCDSWSGDHRRYDFKQSFKDQLKSQGLPETNVYTNRDSSGNNPCNWDFHDDSTPTLNGVSVHTFWYAYKTINVNLLGANSWRIWSSCLNTTGCDDVKEYTDINNLMSWTKNYDFRSDIGEVILSQKMTNHKVTFNGNGHGTNIPQDQYILDLNKVNRPSDPADSNYDYVGWYKDAECTKTWDFNQDVITTDTTLYAKWVPVIDSSKMVPIQQGTTTKVNFLPVYNGDTPPCNFYKKESNGSFTLISDITSMGILGQKIQEIGPENVYTDGCGQTFYGCYDTVWTNAFEDGNIKGRPYLRYDFKQSFKDQLKSQGLPETNVYTNKDSSGNNPSNWDYHDDSTPTINDVSVHTFWYAYKYNNVNLLSPTSWRLWSSCYDSIGITEGWYDVKEYKHSNNEMSWHKNYNFRSDTGAVILSQKMINYKVSFNGNGHGTNIPQDQYIINFNKVNIPSDPTDSDYTFVGWYKDAECTKTWNFNQDVITADTALYAKWVPVTVIDPSKMIPIQQGTKTKVNFLPVYNGDTPPCNFYKKEVNGTLTFISNITTMDSLGQRIQEIGPENVYTDGCGQTFYGCYDTVWTNAFEDENSIGGTYPRYDFKESFKDQLKSQGLPITNVYTNRDSSGNNPSNWDYHDDSTPTINGVSVHTFWYAYKYNNVNLLSPTSCRLWSSCINTWGSDDVKEYRHSNNEMSWHKNYNFRSETGAVILSQKMINHKVTFNGNGHGTNIPQDQLVLNHHLVNRPPDAKDSNYDFVDWYKDAECTKVWDFNKDVITVETTLYARWIPPVEPCRMRPIQHGWSTKVNFLPVYSGDTPPCNFYYRRYNTYPEFKLITGITNMASLAEKIHKVGPSSVYVYTDAYGQNFYGCYDTVWSNAFSNYDIVDGDYRSYDFKDSFKDELINNCLPVTNIYTNRDRDGNNPSNWDYHNDSTPTINGVDVHTFWRAYRNSKFNLLSDRSDRIWSSYFYRCRSLNKFNETYVREYVDTGNEMKWNKQELFTSVDELWQRFELDVDNTQYDSVILIKKWQ